MSDTVLAVRSSGPLPTLVINAGERASVRFLEFFASTICNPTRGGRMRTLWTSS